LVHSDSDFEIVQQSSLHPYSSQAPVLVRFSASPVYAANDTSKTKAIAVLLLGDIENGKLNVVDTTNQQFGNGESSVL
jgi:hypothetical protein